MLPHLLEEIQWTRPKISGFATHADQLPSNIRAISDKDLLMRTATLWKGVIKDLPPFSADQDCVSALAGNHSWLQCRDEMGHVAPYQRTTNNGEQPMDGALYSSNYFPIHMVTRNLRQEHSVANALHSVLRQLPVLPEPPGSPRCSRLFQFTKILIFI